MMHWSIFVILLHVPVLWAQHLYPAPEHGALVCYPLGRNDRFCIVLCKEGTDFLFNPPLMYYSSAGQWNFWAFPGQLYESRLPWPNCTANANPSWLKSQALASHFFDGDCNDPNVQERLKDNAWAFFTGPSVPPPFCRFRPDCRKDNLQVYCGIHRVFARWTNGLYYRGLIDSETVDSRHIKFDDGDQITHPKTDTKAIVMDVDPPTSAVTMGTEVIAWWPNRVRYYPGHVDRVESDRYHIKYDDGDEGWARIDQLRVYNL